MGEMHRAERAGPRIASASHLVDLAARRKMQGKSAMQGSPVSAHVSGKEIAEGNNRVGSASSFSTPWALFWQLMSFSAQTLLLCDTTGVLSFTNFAASVIAAHRILNFSVGCCNSEWPRGSLLAWLIPCDRGRRYTSCYGS